jgi:DNA-binding NtrC family response regulator
MPIDHVLIVDADADRRAAWKQHLHLKGLAVRESAALTEDTGDLAPSPVDLLILSGAALAGNLSECLRSLRKRSVPPVVLWVTDEFDGIAKGWREGVTDVLLKPDSSEALDLALERANRWRRASQTIGFQVHQPDLEADPLLLSAGPPMDQVRQSIRKLARTQATVLIQGEYGTGHDGIARALHQQSHRASGPFLRLDCAGRSASDLATALFGFERIEAGGVRTRLDGWVDLADGGTLFLEEINLLPDEPQARMAQLLQTQTYTRLGGDAPVPADVRILASSSFPLETLVKRGQFREDLYILLSIFPLRVPPLRERPEDIPLLADHFRKYFSRKFGLDVLAISPAGLEALQRYAWPGNVRELREVICKALLISGGGGVLEAHHFFSGCSSAVDDDRSARDQHGKDVEDLSLLEKHHIFKILEKCQGNRTHAAKRLGISIRTLRNKLREYRLEAEAQAGAETGPS